MTDNLKAERERDREDGKGGETADPAGEKRNRLFQNNKQPTIHIQKVTKAILS